MGEGYGGVVFRVVSDGAAFGYDEAGVGDAPDFGGHAGEIGGDEPAGALLVERVDLAIERGMCEVVGSVDAVEIGGVGSGHEEAVIEAHVAVEDRRRQLRLEVSIEAGLFKFGDDDRRRFAPEMLAMTISLPR